MQLSNQILVFGFVLRIVGCLGLNEAIPGHIEYEGSAIMKGNANNCDPNPCQNNATCQNDIDSYTCICVHGYEGDNCEIGNAELYVK